MISELKYVTFHIALHSDTGWIGILSSAKGLLRTTLPQPSAQKARELLGMDSAVSSPHLFEDLLQRFRTYFSGGEVTFPDQLDLSWATAFQRRVWEMTRLIPYGNARSYSWVAEQVGRPRAARAVGQALAGNPLPIIVPCHRVLTSDGKVGGYSGGVEMKEYLLHLEAAARIE